MEPEWRVPAIPMVEKRIPCRSISLKHRVSAIAELNSCHNYDFKLSRKNVLIAFNMVNDLKV